MHDVFGFEQTNNLAECCLYVSVLCDTGDYVDRYRHMHGSKPVMIPVDQLVREGRSSITLIIPSTSKSSVS